MNLIPILLLLLIVIVCLYVKGKEDAETFDSELRYLVACIRLFPVTDAAYKVINEQFAKCNKMRSRDKEKLSVAFVEFANKFKVFFPLGKEAEIKNAE